MHPKNHWVHFAHPKRKGLGRLQKRTKRQLILQTGDVFSGFSFGHPEEAQGEVVFGTGMTGYQEVLTDPSYCGQIVVMTYPLVGSYGFNLEDDEANRPHLHGFVVKEAQRHPSNWRSQFTLDEVLRHHNIPGLEGIDTRRLTRIIRSHGTLMGRLCGPEADRQRVVEELKSADRVQYPVSKVSCEQPYLVPGRGRRIALVDYGMKRGILRDLVARGCRVMVFPHTASASDILNWRPDGVLLSNGPGDPMQVPEALPMIQGILGRVPLFGICLGYQLLALACGAKTARLKFGHRGSNHPVRCLESNRVLITSQNHGYTVVMESLAATQLQVTHVSVNDSTVEGITHQDYQASGVQFHPEASPGPLDSQDLFDGFLEQIAKWKGDAHAKTL